MDPFWFQEFAKHQAVERLKKTICSSSIGGRCYEITSKLPKVLARSKECRKALETAEYTKSPASCQSADRKFSVFFPVFHNGQVAGCFLVSRLKQSFSPFTTELVQLTLETAAKELERAKDLKTLSETLQPRCIALSTIHTVHRLISSTLNLEELIPRIARLCCQVLRAQSCMIWLSDFDKNFLILRASIHLNKGRKFSSRPIRIGKGSPGRVAATCQAIITKETMMVPLVEEDCVGVILVRREKRESPFSPLDQEILTTLAEQAVVAIHNARMYETQERVTWGTIKSLSSILDGMDPGSPKLAQDREILVNVARAIAQKLGLPELQQRSLTYAALLHDAGRFGIPEEILRKPSKLEPSEFALVKEHPIHGARILQPLEILEPAVPIILYHHERYDGTGYPKGLKKDEIPLGARILAVANAFEAMICDRPYRSAMSLEKAAQEIASHAGTQFDPEVVQAFLDLMRTKKLETLIHPKIKQSRRTLTRKDGKIERNGI